MRKQKIFRVKPYLKKLIAHKSIDENISNSDFVNKIIKNFDLNHLDVGKISHESKVSKENVPVVYRLDAQNIKKLKASRKSMMSNTQRYLIIYSVIILINVVAVHILLPLSLIPFTTHDTRSKINNNLQVFNTFI